MANEEHNQSEVGENTSAETEVEASNETTEKVATEDVNTMTLEQAQAEIAALQEKLQLADESVLRAQADVQNARRRATQDVEKAHKFGVEKIISDLLPVVDNLERAIESIQGGVPNTAADSSEGNQPPDGLKAVIEGIELTLKSFMDTLKRHNVEPVDPSGQPFDPQFHQAMSMVENAEVEPNTVINVFQKGYTLHGRLVRPAMVVVSKASLKQDA